mgnify:CR=1 FL=1
MNLIFLSIIEDDDDKKFMLNLYQQYYPLMKQRAYSIIKDYGVIDDLIQDAFVKLIPKISLLRSLSSYKMTSYIIYTMKHICLVTSACKRGVLDMLIQELPTILLIKFQTCRLQPKKIICFRRNLNL